MSLTQLEIEGLAAQIKARQRKLNYLNLERINAYDSEKKHALDVQIEEEEAELKQLRWKSREAGAIAPNGEVAKISCDRRKAMRRFWRAFDEREEKGIPLHFYFLTETTNGQGQADSLAMRLVAGLIRENGDEVKFSGMDMLQPVQIVVDPDDEEEDFQYEMRRAFNRSIHPQVANLADFADNIGPKYASYKNARYIPFMFKVRLVNTDSWNRAAVRSLQWFIQDFCRLEGPQSRSFLFFFIIDMSPVALPQKAREALPDGKEKPVMLSIEEIYKRVRAIAKVMETHITVLPPLTRIGIQDLDDWLYNVMKVFNRDDRLRQLEALMEQLGGGEEWDMTPVERVLGELFTAYRNRQLGI